MIYQVFEKKQALYVYPLPELLQMLEEDKLILRETNKVYVRQIRNYIVENVEGAAVYFPPVVAMIVEGHLGEERPQALTIIDGSQRLKAFTSLPGHISKLIYNEDNEKSRQGFLLRRMFPEISVAIQVFEGLNQEEADQLYLDLNTKGKKVALSKRIAYDSRNEINLTTNHLLRSNKKLQIAGIETEKAAVKRPNNKNLMSLSQLRNIVGIFVTGKDVESKLSIKMKKDTNFQDAYTLAEVWLEALFHLYPPNKIGHYEQSMLASYPILLALVHYALENTENDSVEHKQQLIQQRMQALQHVNWSRKQPIWLQFNGSKRGKENYYYLNKDKKTIQSIVEWLKIRGGE